MLQNVELPNAELQNAEFQISNYKTPNCKTPNYKTSNLTESQILQNAEIQNVESYRTSKYKMSTIQNVENDLAWMVNIFWNYLFLSTLRLIKLWLLKLFLIKEGTDWLHVGLLDWLQNYENDLAWMVNIFWNYLFLSTFDTLDFLTPEWWDGTQHRMDLKIIMCWVADRLFFHILHHHQGPIQFWYRLFTMASHT